MRPTGLVALLVAAAVVPAPAGAESAAGAEGPGVALAQWSPGQVPGDTVPGSLHGVVFDSTRARVLRGARVAVIGTAISTETDSSGVFTLSGIPPGEYSIAFHHPRLQELGVSPGAPMVTLEPGDDLELRLTIPSRQTILRGWCALEQGGKGAAHVGGVVRDSLTGVALPNARVELGLASGADGEGRVRFQARTDDSGRFRFCNVVGERWMSLRARFGNEESKPVAVRPVEGGGTIHDFAMPLSHEVQITGRVLDRETLAPLQGAHVQVVGTWIEGMTGEAGRFHFEGLPPGRHVLVTENLGYEKRIDTLTVFSREALGVEIHLSTDPIPLEPLVVVGRSRGQEMPWSVGTRVDGMSRSEIEDVLPRTRDAADLLRLANIPGLNVRRVSFKDGGFTTPGICVEVARARRLAPETCAMVSVYLDGVRLGQPQYTLETLEHTAIERIQLLTPLEAGALYGRDGRNGVLLIETR